MYSLKTNFIPENEIEEEIRPFALNLPDNTIVAHEFSSSGGIIDNRVEINGRLYAFSDKISANPDTLAYTREFKRICRHCVYKAMSDYTQVNMPWGSLTGIRPTKLAYEYLATGGNKENVAEYLSKKFEISPKKAKIIQNIVLCQAEYLCTSSQFVNLYVHIPFCPTKCRYCAFITHIAEKYADIIPAYCDCLSEEIKRSVDLIEKSGCRIFSIYIGGGTPTSLPDVQFEKILSAIPDCKVEFTCEAGRPDSITPSKAELMKKYGVTRVCVNPQTLCDQTLKIIGREHSAEDFFDAYRLIDQFSFDINVDLIAGLPGESQEIFASSLKKTAELRPHNITVHTLSIKNGSAFKNEGFAAQGSRTAEKVDFAYGFLTDAGYLPYYLYRQKNMLDNLENIGYSLPGKICVNNVTVMEETLSVMACGAGAISKRLFGGGRIERLANLRDAGLYIDQFEDRLKKKLKFFEKRL